jgi:hypothetical protein
MTTDIKEAARASARISDGDEFPEPHMEPQPRQARYVINGCVIAPPFVGYGTEMQLTHINEIPVADIDWHTGDCMHPSRAQARKLVPLAPGLTLDELLQRPMPWTGLTIAAAIVCFCAWVALLVHAAGVHGWLR